MANTKRFHVFLCHASEDKPAVRKLYERLTKDGIDAWLEEEKLLPGQDWQLEISKAVKASDAIIVLLSTQSVKKAGFVQKEIKLALDVANEKPEGTIYFIPARLDECTVPDSLRNYQWVNLFDDRGYERIKKALQTRTDLLETDNATNFDKDTSIDTKSTQITILIEKNILKFTDTEKNKFIFAISKLTGVSSNQVRILQVAEGSVVITLEMPEIAAKKLMELYYKNDVEIEKLGISSISFKLESEENKKLDSSFITSSNERIATMELKIDRISAREQITILLHEGNSLLEKITSEYMGLRQRNTFDQEKHIPQWQREYSGWFSKCLSVFGETFPTSREVIKLKNAPVSPVVQAGTNLRWASLTNTIKSKLTALDEIIEILSSYKDGIKRISILFLAADPSDAVRLRLGEEFREIQEQLKQAKKRDIFTLELPQLSVRPKDVSQALLDFQPQIVHFSGHGTSTGALCFENQLGQTHPIQPRALAALFEQFTSQVNCVVLNACYSEVQANAIAEHIEYVIGMSQAVGDKAAIAFATGFYQALGAGRTIEDAYKLGCAQIGLQGIPEYSTPVLKSFGLKILKVLNLPRSGGRTKKGIGDDLGLDIASVDAQLNKLEKNGYVSVERTNGERWTITTTGKKLLADTNSDID